MNLTKHAFSRGLTAAAMLALLPAAAQADIEREGEGEHRTTLNAMEGAAFPADAIATLEDWMGGEVAASALEGGVTVFVTLAPADQGSMIFVPTLNRLARTYPDQLTIVGVVTEDGWDRVREMHDAGRINFAIARDAGGAFRAAMHADDEPDIYVVDTAGQLRYADITNHSIRGGEFRDLFAERASDAIANAKAEAESRDAAVVDAEAGVESVSEGAYADADWPSHNSSSRISGTDMQGEALPVALGRERWISEKIDTEGKVIVLDFWATWCGPCKKASPTLNKLQKEYDGKLAVLAIGGQSEDFSDVKRYADLHEDTAYSFLFDNRQRIFKALSIKAIPHTVVLSTDGVIRWQGNPLEDNFSDVVKQVIEADPITGTGGARDDVATAADGAWPEHNDGKLYGTNVQGKPLPMDFTRGLDWLTPRVDSFEGKTVIIDFWATWCGPCKALSPVLDSLQERYGDDLVVLGISGQKESKGDVERYLREHRSGYAHAFDPRQRLYKMLDVSGIPHVLVISSDGIVRWQGFPGDHDAFVETVDKIVEADRASRESGD